MKEVIYRTILMINNDLSICVKRGAQDRHDSVLIFKSSLNYIIGALTKM